MGLVGGEDAIAIRRIGSQTHQDHHVLIIQGSIEIHLLIEVVGVGAVLDLNVLGEFVGFDRDLLPGVVALDILGQDAGKGGRTGVPDQRIEGHNKFRAERTHSDLVGFKIEFHVDEFTAVREIDSWNIK